MSKTATVIIPSYCPDATVRGYETECLRCLESNTPRELYDLVIIGGGDWSFPQKVNAAMTGVRTEFVFVLSNDVFVPPNWMETMLADFENAERIADCAVLAPADEPHDERIFWVEHWWALVLFRAETYRRIGGLDESLPHSYHDQDLSIRLTKQGHTILRTQNVVVKHINMATRSRMKYDDEPERREMRRRYGVTEHREIV